MQVLQREGHVGLYSFYFPNQEGRPFHLHTLSSPPPANASSEESSLGTVTWFILIIVCTFTFSCKKPTKASKVVLSGLATRFLQTTLPFWPTGVKRRDSVLPTANPGE